jgi:hypothetical protein
MNPVAASGLLADLSAQILTSAIFGKWSKANQLTGQFAGIS